MTERTEAMKRSLSDICEELCPGVKARNAGVFKRDPDSCMHGLYIHTCENPTCKSISAELDRKRKEIR
jgi:hypothetical protein